MPELQKAAEYPDLRFHCGSHDADFEKLNSVWGDNCRWAGLHTNFNLLDKAWIERVTEYQKSVYNEGDEQLSDLDFSKMYDDEGNITLSAPYRIKRLILNVLHPETIMHVLLVSLAVHQKYIIDINDMITSNEGVEGK